MTQNGRGQPILIAGGGIGGLAAGYALARKGFPVRILEQAPEFREIGAGIQLGPNIFRALDKIGLKDAVLADAHRPPAMEMRCALSGDTIVHMALEDEGFKRRFQYPYAVSHRADIHATLLHACQSNNLISLETKRTVDSYEEHDNGVTVVLATGERIEGRALIGCDGMWSNIRARIVHNRIWYYSDRAIKRGEELTVDYHYDTDLKPMPCRCGAPTCRGTMNLPPPPTRRR